MLRQLALILLLCSSPAGAEAYRWLDASGNTHYGDHPPEDARQLRNIPVYEGLYTVKRVFDGDTVQLEDGRRLRLIGINTPERAHGRAPVEAGAEAAYNWLHQRLQGQRVGLQFDRERSDRYGRWLVYLHDERGADIGLALLRAGLAHANIHPPNTARSNRYLAAEAEARAAGRGIWSLPSYALVELPRDHLHSGFIRLRGVLLGWRDGRKYRYLQLPAGVEAALPRSQLTAFPDMASLKGQSLTLRGWLKRRGEGWRLYLNDPLQLEALDNPSP